MPITFIFSPNNGFWSIFHETVLKNRHSYNWKRTKKNPIHSKSSHSTHGYPKIYRIIQIHTKPEPKKSRAFEECHYKSVLFYILKIKLHYVLWICTSGSRTIRGPAVFCFLAACKIGIVCGIFSPNCKSATTAIY